MNLSETGRYIFQPKRTIVAGSLSAVLAFSSGCGYRQETPTPSVPPNKQVLSEIQKPEFKFPIQTVYISNGVEIKSGEGAQFSEKGILISPGYYYNRNNLTIINNSRYDYKLLHERIDNAARECGVYDMTDKKLNQVPVELMYHGLPIINPDTNVASPSAKVTYSDISLIRLFISVPYAANEADKLARAEGKGGDPSTTEKHFNRLLTESTVRIFCATGGRTDYEKRARDTSEAISNQTKPPYVIFHVANPSKTKN